MNCRSAFIRKASCFFSLFSNVFSTFFFTLGRAFPFNFCFVPVSYRPEASAQMFHLSLSPSAGGYLAATGYTYAPLTAQQLSAAGLPAAYAAAAGPTTATVTAQPQPAVVGAENRIQ